MLQPQLISMKQIYSLLLCVLLTLNTSYGQTIAKDTLRVKELIDLCDSIEFAEPHRALALYKEAYELSTNQDYHWGAFKATLFSGYIQANLGQYDSAHFYYDRADLLCAQSGDEVDQANVHLNRANTFMFEGDLDKSLEYHYSGIKLFEDRGDSSRLIGAYANAAAVFGDMDDYDKEIEYLEKSLSVTPTNNWLDLSLTYGDIGATYLQKADYELAYENLSKADSASRQIDNAMVDFMLLRHWGDYYTFTHQYSKAISYCERTLELSRTYGNKLYEVDILRVLGDCHLELGNLEQAKEYLDEGLSLAEEQGSVEMSKKVLILLSRVHEQMGDYERAHSYLNQHMLVKDSILSELHIKSINELEVKYEAQKKDAELLSSSLELQKSTNRTRQIGLGLVIVSLLALFSFLWYRIRLRNQSQAARLELEKVLIESTEEERERIARELHDGTGSLLTGIKLSLEGISNEVVNEPIKERLQKSITQVRSVAKEVRRVSHAMAPSAIERLKYEDVIGDMLQTYREVGTAVVDYGSSGNLEVMNKTERLMIYRILQECLNNSFKHSEATEITVSISVTQDNAELLYQDNGQGYDRGQATKGIGLDSIDKRIKYLNGNRTLETEQGKGVLLIINFPLGKHE